MLYIQDMNGDTEPLLVNDVHITQQLNTIEQLDFSTVNIPENEPAFQMLQPRSIVIVPDTGEMYRITENDGARLGDKYQRTVTGLQVLQDLDDHLTTDKLTGIQSIDNVMKFLVKGTQFTYTVHDVIPDFDFGEDGTENERLLELFTDTIVSNFKIEFVAHNYHIDIYKSMGKHNSFVFLSGNDIYTLDETGDYTQIRTHIIGYGKTDDNGNSSIKAEYTSPNSKVYGIIDDDLYTDDNITDENTLLSAMKEKLLDYPQIQYTANVNKFVTNNYTDELNDSTMGNWGYIRDRNGIDIESRIIQRDLYPQSNQEDTLTFGNFVLDPNKMIAQMNSSRNSDMEAIKKLQSTESISIDKQFDITKVGEVSD